MFGSAFISGFRLALILCAGFGAGAVVFLLPTFRTGSSVIERVNMTGTIVMVAPAPLNPKATVGRGLDYTYVVELSDGTRVWIRDSVKFPHNIGSQVTIERGTRENGSRFHMFSRPGNANVPTL